MNFKTPLKPTTSILSFRKTKTQLIKKCPNILSKVNVPIFVLSLVVLNKSLIINNTIIKCIEESCTQLEETPNEI